MCLENDYDNGREYISEHPDDEKQMHDLHDVYCWVTGPAARLAVFRVKLVNKKVPPQLHQYCCNSANPEGTRDLFSIEIPAGLYVMRGRCFQERYSHEFPQCQETLFKRLLKFAPTLWVDFPVLVPKTDRGASAAPTVQAAWIKQNSARVRAAIADGKICKKKGAPTDDDAAFAEWCLERTSYTLRRFSTTVDGKAISESPKKREREEDAPVPRDVLASIDAMIEYRWDAEFADFQECEEENERLEVGQVRNQRLGHIFNDFQRVDAWREHGDAEPSNDVLSSIRAIVSYAWEREENDYNEEEDKNHHIFNHIRRVGAWLDDDVTSKVAKKDDE